MGLKTDEITKAATCAVAGMVLLVLAAVGARLVFPKVEAKPVHSGQQQPGISQSGPGSAATSGDNSPATVYNNSTTVSHYTLKSSPIPSSLQRIILSPGRTPTPHTPCDGDANFTVPKGSLTVPLGTNGLIFYGFPVSFIMIHHVPLLSINKIGGKILISLVSLSDENGERIADITENKVWIRDGYEATLNGKSNLIIYDKTEHKNETLNINYINPHALIFSGIFNYEGVSVSIKGGDITTKFRGGPTSHMLLNGMCMSSGTGSISMFSFGS